jgi:hypothetical protein
MTAVITASAETTDPLALGLQAPASGRAPADGFDLLIALLQAQLTPSPTPGAESATLVAAAPAAPTDPLAVETATTEDSVAPLLTLPSPAPRRGPRAVLGEEVMSGTGDGRRPLLPPEEEPRETSMTASAAGLVAPVVAPGLVTPVLARVVAPVLVPVTNDVPAAPEPVAVPREAVPALAPRAAAPAPMVAASAAGVSAPAPSDQPFAEIVVARPASAEPAAPAAPAPTASTAVSSESAAPAEVLTANAPVVESDSRPRLVRSPRGRDAERADAPDALDMVGEDVAQRLGMASAARVTRVTPDREVAGDRPALRPRDGEVSSGSADSTAFAPPAPVSVSATRATAELAEPPRFEPARDPVEQIATRVRDVKGPGRHEISLRLDPPHLGAVRIDARLDGGQLHLQIRAEHAPTGELLAEALPRLRESLSQQGFVPAEVSVHLGLDASGRQFSQDSAPTFTPPRDGEPAPAPPPVRVPAAHPVVATDGLDVWA